VQEPCCMTFNTFAALAAVSSPAGRQGQRRLATHQIPCKSFPRLARTMWSLSQTHQSVCYRNVAVHQSPDLQRASRRKTIKQLQKTAAPSTSAPLRTGVGLSRPPAESRAFSSSSPKPQESIQLLKSEPLSSLDVDAELWQVTIRWRETCSSPTILHDHDCN
jgi:hypothetical protein